MFAALVNAEKQEPLSKTHSSECQKKKKKKLRASAEEFWLPKESSV